MGRLRSLPQWIRGRFDSSVLQGARILDSPWLVGVVAIVAGAVAAVSGFDMGSLLTPLLVLSMPTAHVV